MLEIKNVSFAYGKKSLFSYLNVSFKPGGIVGLLGKNGAGKTTLLKIMAGLIFPGRGSCEVRGEVPGHRRPSFLQHLFFLPEEFALPAISIDRYQEFYAAFYPRFSTVDFDGYLKEFSLSRDDRLLTQLSHGQQKKFLIAFGLATHCPLLILDEPTNGLDISSKAEFRKLLVSASTEQTLVIISTHQVHDVENVIDSLVILDEGQVVLHQSMQAIAERLAFVVTPEEPVPSECFYAEKRLGSYITVVANKNYLETEVDLEVLFGAVLANKVKMNALFEGVSS